MIEGGQITDPMGVAGEDGRDGRAEVVPNSRGTEGPDLTDGVATNVVVLPADETGANRVRDGDEPH
jgi:hypothetical protein